MHPKCFIGVMHVCNLCSHVQPWVVTSAIPVQRCAAEGAAYGLHAHTQRFPRSTLKAQFRCVGGSAITCWGIHHLLCQALDEDIAKLRGQTVRGLSPFCSQLNSCRSVVSCMALLFRAWHDPCWVCVRPTIYIQIPGSLPSPLL